MYGVIELTNHTFHDSSRDVTMATNLWAKIAYMADPTLICRISIQTTETS